MPPFLQSRPVSYSRTKITEPMMPHHASFDGHVNASVLLGLMERVAFACASRHAGNYCVTASVQEIEFLFPVKPGDLVMVEGTVNYVGQNSLTVKIYMESQDICSRESPRHTATGYFHMIAKKPDGQVASVPPLLLETPEDLRHFYEGLIQKDARNAARNGVIQNYNIDRVLERIGRERCEIGFDIDTLG